MSIPPLPREGARPSQVRLAAWQHAHRAHEMMLEAAEVCDRSTPDTEAEDAYVAAQLVSGALGHAGTAQALASVLSFDRMPGT